jgi:hypothetical protein
MSKTLKFSILDRSTGVATGNFLFVQDSHISQVSDGFVGSVACVNVASRAPDAFGIASFSCAGSASEVLDLLGLDEFLALTVFASDGATTHIRASDIEGFYPANDAPSSPGDASAVRVVTSWGRIDVTDSQTTIAAAIGPTAVVS